MIKRLVGLVVAASAAIVLAACATRATTLNMQWVSPEFAGKGSVRNVMVMAVTRDSTNRRAFEDRMVAALTAAGVKAVQSYKFIAQDGPVTEDQLRRAVTDAGVSHAMSTRISNVTTDVSVSHSMMTGPGWGPGFGWDRGSGPGWGGATGFHNTMWAGPTPPQVTTTQNVHADTRLYDAKTAAVLWSAATTTTTGFDTVPQMIDQFVQLIVDTMKKDAVI